LPDSEIALKARMPPIWNHRHLRLPTHRHVLARSRKSDRARAEAAADQFGTNSLLVDMPNDDAAPVNVGANAASQLHIVEKDYGHALLAF
jgi:hypothetical protein